MAVSIRGLEQDANLVMAVQAGDTDAYGELFRRHYPAVRRVCARRLGSLVEADETAQAAFVRALERIDRCGGERRFGAWVQTIAQRLCIDTIRARTRTTPDEEPVKGAMAEGPNVPEDALLRSEEADQVHLALATLPARQREVLIARHLEERRPGEIAAALGLSLGAVDSLLLRGRRRLANAFQAVSTDAGFVNSSTAAAATFATGVVAGPTRLARVAQAVSGFVQSVSFHVGSAMGLVPGMPSAADQALTAIAIGAAVLAPAVLPAAPAAPVELPSGLSAAAVPDLAVPTDVQAPATLPVDLAPVAPVIVVPPPTTEPAELVAAVEQSSALTPTTGELGETVRTLLHRVGGIISPRESR